MSGSISAPDFRVGTTLSTPAGSPTSSSTRASASIDSGVSAAGLITIVQPAAIAGPIFRVPIASGKFHGVMNRQGPTGWRIVSNRDAPLGATLYEPSIRQASSENQRKNSAAYVTSATDSASGLPISSVISNAKSSLRDVISSNAERRISLRSRGGVAAHSRCASAAAASAASPSAGSASATSVSTLPVLGSSTSKAPLPPACHFPPIHN